MNVVGVRPSSERPLGGLYHHKRRLVKTVWTTGIVTDVGRGMTSDSLRGFRPGNVKSGTSF